MKMVEKQNCLSTSVFSTFVKFKQVYFYFSLLSHRSERDISKLSKLVSVERTHFHSWIILFTCTARKTKPSAKLWRRSKSCYAINNMMMSLIWRDVRKVGKDGCSNFFWMWSTDLFISSMCKISVKTNNTLYANFIYFTSQIFRDISSPSDFSFSQSSHQRHHLTSSQLEFQAECWL